MKTNDMYTKQYEIIDIVLSGQLWCGDQAAYRRDDLPDAPAFFLSLDDLIDFVQKHFDDGTLKTDDFAGINGAIVSIQINEYVYVNGKQFSRSSDDFAFIGDLTDDQKDSLLFAQTDYD